ncbi:MAG: hypothetical protein ACI3YH_06315 [Eubacteriales bacterium]
MKYSIVKNNATWVGSAILSFVAILLLYVAGSVSSPWMSEALKDSMGAVCVISLLLIVLTAVFSFVRGKRYAKRLNEQRVTAMRDFMLSRKESAEADPDSVMKKIGKMQRLLWSFYLQYLILFIAFVFALGAADVTIGVTTALLLGAYLLLTVGIHRMFIMGEKPDFSEYTPQECIPELYRIAESAADAVGVEVKGKLRILLMPDCNAGICRMGKDVSLQLGTQLISVLGPEELYQILLHEFAHLQYETRVYKFGVSRAYRFLNAGDGKLGDRLLDGLLCLPGMMISVEYEICRMVISEHSERIADQVVRQKGNPTLASAALCKTVMGDLFAREIDSFITDHFYEAEEVRTDLNETVCNAFRSAILLRKDFWWSLLEKELTRPLGSHPIFRQRWEALGSPAFEITLPAEDSLYYADCLWAQRLISSRTVENIKDDYPQLHQECYIEPLRRIEEFEASDEQLTAPEIPPILNAYGGLGRYEEQEALCDRLLADDRYSEYETVAALYGKGIRLLARYDEAGADLIYRAIELNSNYMNDGLEQIAEFFHWMGLADRMEAHRAKAVELAQKYQDLGSHTGALEPSDHLASEDFDGDGRLPSMLEYMVEAGEGKLMEIYLVRKIISPDFFTSAFVLRYEMAATEEERNDIYDKVFHYLDNYPLDWQYSLFDYDEQIEKAIKKVDGSCVYRKR